MSIKIGRKKVKKNLFVDGSRQFIECYQPLKDDSYTDRIRLSVLLESNLVTTVKRRLVSHSNSSLGS
jgi:hypothetical protein